MSRVRHLVHLTLVLATSLVLTACGGGGGGGSSYTPPPSGGGGGTTTTGWVSGVFKAASTFKDLCQTVRTGNDSEGNPFTDKAGSSLDEKNWLRSWTHETYLWNTEVTDTNPSLGGTPLVYFDSLKTNATTASGKAKDEFHFSEPTADYLARANSSASASYGANIAVLSGRVPRDVRIAYTEPGSPAEEIADGQPKLIRGSKILTVNGVDLVNGATTQAQIDALNAALFPASTGITTTLTVRDPGASVDRTVTLTSQNLTEKSVNRTRILTNATGDKTGYVLFNTFSPYASEKDLSDTMQAMKDQGVKGLVLDLRYNGGGLLTVASELGYMIAGSSHTAGKTFEKLRFNNGSTGNDPVTGQPNNPIPFYSTAQGFSIADGTALPSLDLGRVFVLTTDSTCSASEAVINGLRGAGVEVVQIGGKTCGKPYGFYPQDNCGTTWYSIQFQGVNDVGFGNYADGFEPADASDPVGVKITGCTAADDFNHDLGNNGETLLRTALSYAANNTCPSVPVAAFAASRSAAPAVSNAPELIPPRRWVPQTNRTMTRHP